MPNPVFDVARNADLLFMEASPIHETMQSSLIESITYQSIPNQLFDFRSVYDAARENGF